MEERNHLPNPNASPKDEPSSSTGLLSNEMASNVPLPAKETPRGIAPLWHTLILVAAILGYSIWGAVSASSANSDPLAPHSATRAASQGTDSLRLIRYGLSGAVELAVVAWIAFGLRMRKIPFRSLFGAWPKDLNGFTLEVLVAAAFWVCSMITIAALAFGWLLVQSRVEAPLNKQASPIALGGTDHYGAGVQAAKSPAQKQSEIVRQLMELAPANGLEIAAWGVLCLLVGFSEELIFRGYLQTQCFGVMRHPAVALLTTALVFGAAHGYQGLRGIVIISVFGLLFGVLARLRKNLFPGMLAHSWHDFATGMFLALVRSTHMLDHLATGPK